MSLCKKMIKVPKVRSYYSPKVQRRHETTAKVDIANMETHSEIG